MADSKYIKIAKETIEITKQGYYYLNNKKVKLITHECHDFSFVEVFNEKKLGDIQNDEDVFFKKLSCEKEACNFTIVEGDCLDVAQSFENPLGMNFANALYPGGGFLNGAHAQEESICRCSTLYESLISEKASEMYRYNSKHWSPIDSEYMLLSPNVCVFRDGEYNLLEEPFTVSIITIAALNLRGRSKNLSQSDVDHVMKERLRKFFMVAARSGYDNIILGAWGCGAFGHDAKVVSTYFKDLLIEEGYNKYFKNIVFAILGNGYNLKAFIGTFGDMADLYTDELCRERKEIKHELTFRESTYPMPICNHTKDIEKENIGYTQGIMMDGMPFEAEIIEEVDEININIILHEIKELCQEKRCNSKSCCKNSIVGYEKEVQRTDNSVLAIGMVEKQIEGNRNVLENYLDYFVKMKLLTFPNNYYNGAMRYFVDIEGNALVGIIITLKEKDYVLAECNLNFKPFKKNDTKNILRIVK